MPWRTRCTDHGGSTSLVAMPLMQTDRARNVYKDGKSIILKHADWSAEVQSRVATGLACARPPFAEVKETNGRGWPLLRSPSFQSASSQNTKLPGEGACVHPPGGGNGDLHNKIAFCITWMTDGSAMGTTQHFWFSTWK